ncbi:MAG: hypothetical protein ACRDYW_04425 [Acidimicrobiales bacterium]
MADVLRAFDDALELDWDLEPADGLEPESRFGLGGPVPVWPVPPRLGPPAIG